MYLYLNVAAHLNDLLNLFSKTTITTFASKNFERKNESKK